MKLTIIFCLSLLSASVRSQSPDSVWYADKILPNYYIDTGINLPASVFVDEQGNRKTLEDYKGKLLYIDVWATWCGNCLVKFPYQEQLMKRLKAINLDTAVVFININIDDTKREWKNAVRKYKPTGINLYSSDTSLYEKWNMPSLPAYLLLDTSNRVLAKEIAQPDDGSIDWILYAASKGIHPVKAVWTMFRQEQLKEQQRTKTAFTDKEYADWYTATFPAMFASFQWREKHLRRKRVLPR